MDEHGYDYCIPRRPDPSVEIKPFIDLTSGYVLRSIEQFPKQGDRTPWRMHQNYPRDILLVRRGEIEDEGVEFGRTPVADAPERLAA
jgi:monooxygenase